MRSRTRLCSVHWGVAEPHLKEHEVLEDVSLTSYDETPHACPTCGELVEGRGAQLFVTAYPTKEERKDYWLQVHDHCGTPKWLPWKAQAEKP
jgi:hypothetical protein